MTVKLKAKYIDSMAALLYFERFQISFSVYIDDSEFEKLPSIGVDSITVDKDGKVISEPEVTEFKLTKEQIQKWRSLTFELLRGLTDEIKSASWAEHMGISGSTVMVDGKEVTDLEESFESAINVPRKFDKPIEIEGKTYTYIWQIDLLSKEPWFE